MKPYFIDYHTGAGNETAATLEEAKAIADEGACYTQEPISIYGPDGDEITRRPWNGAEYDPDEEEAEPAEIISFGKFGYYGPWD